MTGNDLDNLTLLMESPQDRGITGAGGVVPSERKGFTYIVSDGNTWSLPKGRINPNEAVDDAALRETMEEIQIPVKISYSLGDYRNNDHIVRFYLMEIASSSEVKLPPKDEDLKIEEVTWAEAVTKVEYYQVAAILKAKKILESLK